MGESLIDYILAILIGLTLGLLGGGGSILTVPILVYILKMDTKLSIALSLAIVGITSLFGVISHFRNKNVDIKTALIFGPFAMLGTFAGTKLSQFISGQIQLVLFAVIMIIAAIFMFKGRKDAPGENSKKESTKLFLILLALQGVFVGIITGIVGVGGGFLIVPALVLLAKTPMKKAIGTSLLLISLNSLTGFLGYMDQIEVPWAFLLKFSSCSVLGIFIGSYFVQYVSQKTLKKAFAIFLILMGFFILYKNRATLMNTTTYHNIEQERIYT